MCSHGCADARACGGHAPGRSRVAWRCTATPAQRTQAAATWRAHLGALVPRLLGPRRLLRQRSAWQQLAQSALDQTISQQSRKGKGCLLWGTGLGAPGAEIWKATGNSRKDDDNTQIPSFCQISPWAHCPHRTPFPSEAPPRSPSRWTSASCSADDVQRCGAALFRDCACARAKIGAYSLARLPGSAICSPRQLLRAQVVRPEAQLWGAFGELAPGQAASYGGRSRLDSSCGDVSVRSSPLWCSHKLAESLRMSDANRVGWRASWRAPKGQRLQQPCLFSALSCKRLHLTARKGTGSLGHFGVACTLACAQFVGVVVFLGCLTSVGPPFLPRPLPRIHCALGRACISSEAGGVAEVQASAAVFIS